MTKREAECFWLAGLTDGEGCFSFYLRSKKHGYYSFDFSFKIAMRSDDIATLKEARRILGVKGSLYTSRRKRVAGYKGKTYEGKPLSALRFQKKSEIAVIIEFFRKFPLRSKKRRDFEIWAGAFNYYLTTIAANKVKAVGFGMIDRLSEVKRRPLVGTSIIKFRRTPPDVIDVMRKHEMALKDGRRYVAS